jgi:hypothetical protein
MSIPPKTTPGNLPSFRISLRMASKLSRVPYDTLVRANRSCRLKLVHEQQPQYNQCLFVELFDLTTYMVEKAPKQYRWVPRRTRIADIIAAKENQPRQRQDKDLIDRISDDIRLGAAVSPVWLIRNSEGRLVLVDGFHRLESHLLAQLSMIWAVEVRLPSEFLPLLTVTSNRNHGRNLTPGDLRAYVVQYLRRWPDILAEILAGTRLQSELAKELGVSPATLTRAVKEMCSKTTEVTLTPREMLLRLRPLYGHLDAPGGDDCPLVAHIFHKALGSVVARYSDELKAHLRQQIKLKSSVATRLLDPEVYKLLDRRGGDRRRRECDFVRSIPNFSKPIAAPRSTPAIKSN